MTGSFTIPSVVLLDNSVRNYAWGSTKYLQTMLGLPVDGEPAAELWIGTHPGAPSQVRGTEFSLRDVIAADPKRFLGEAVVARFGADLPFLLKVLAAARPLSIQAHPTREQAASGFAAENERGVPIGARHRNYPDTNHKPELICALTPFEALCGFRHASDSADFVRVLVDHGATSLADVPEQLLAPDGLREVVTWLLRMPDPDVSALLDPLLPAAAAVAGSGVRWSHDASLTGRLAALYPNDPGIAVALLMNVVRLEPGQALFLSAGRIHAYLEGAGVELMASSDNVLRSGLTSKNVDVDELLRIVDFSTEDAVPLSPRDFDGRHDYVVPVDDFALSSYDVTPSSGVDLCEPGPSVLLCVDGSMGVSAADVRVDLPRGAAVFVAAGTPVSVTGVGALFHARTGVSATD